jgi:hypothetical protein
VQPSRAVGPAPWGPEPWQPKDEASGGSNPYREFLRAAGNAAMRRSVMWRPYAVDESVLGPMHGLLRGDNMPTVQALGLMEWSRPAGSSPCALPATPLEQLLSPFQISSLPTISSSGGYMLPPPPPLLLETMPTTSPLSLTAPHMPLATSSPCLSSVPAPCSLPFQQEISQLQNLPVQPMQQQLPQQQASPDMLCFLMPGAQNGGLNSAQIAEQLRAAATETYED